MENDKNFLRTFFRIGGVLALFGALAVSAQSTSGPSAFCHETDGAFTLCGGRRNTEWSDITGTSFFDVNGALLSVLYVDQADKDPLRSIPDGSGIDTLMLMYDEVQRTQPLGSSESVHVHFMTVDDGALLHYDVFIGAGGIQRVLINDVEQVPMPSGLSGQAGFGTSPNSATPHVIAEFQIGLEAAGFTSEECCYSPDPAWWGSDVPPNPQEPPRGEPCPEGTIPVEIVPLQLTGDTQFTIDQQRQLCLQEPESTTAAVFTANLDGTTTVEPKPLLPPGEEPTLCESIGLIVDFRVPPDGVYKNHGAYVKQVAQLTEALVDSQVAAGLISAEEGEKLQSCVVNPRARSNVGK